MYNISMIIITINDNEKNQRLDRFMRKYYKNAPLSYIYKLLRTGVKVNGRRVAQNTVLALGDQLSIDISEEEQKKYLAKKNHPVAKVQFTIAYEDENILIVDKPYGLLTHGAEGENKNTLVNQVVSYLIDSGSYSPEDERTFAPAPANRLDRNTTGLVLFGKNAETLKNLSAMLRKKGSLRRYYKAIVWGEIKDEMILKDIMKKDIHANISRTASEEEAGKLMETRIIPIKRSKGFTLLEAELLTGRSHQIRSQLAKAGHPILGDVKYGGYAHRGSQDFRKNIEEKIPQNVLGQRSQLLHSHRLVFADCPPSLEYIQGKEISCELPTEMLSIRELLFGR